MYAIRSYYELQEEVLKLFPNPKWETLLMINFKQYNRYSRDQCLEIKKYFSHKEIDLEVLDLSLDYCLENKTYSISNLKDTYIYFNNLESFNTEIKKDNYVKTQIKEKITVNKRNINVYQSIIQGEQHEII